MPWGLDAGELSTIRELSPAIAEVREIPAPRGRGLFPSVVSPALRHVPGLRNLRPTMTVMVRFAATSV